MSMSYQEPAWELTPEEVTAGEQPTYIKPKRASVALTLLMPSYNLAYDQVKTQESKASILAGWIAAVIALSAGQMSSQIGGVQRNLLIFCFVAFLAAFFVAVSALAPRSTKASALPDPLELYNYQSANAWDQRASARLSGDELADTMTQKALIEQVNAAIEALYRCRDYSASRVYGALLTFGIGMVSLIVSIILASLSHGVARH